MRVSVDKYLFHGAEEDRKPFFAAAQKLGIIEFIQEPEKVPDTLTTFVDANRILRHLEPQPQEERGTLADAERIVALQHKLDGLSEQERLLQQEIARVEAFGDFSPKDLAYISQEGNRVIQFFCSKEMHSDVIHVGTAHGLHYFIAINTHPMHYEGLTEMQVPEPVSEVRARLASVKKQHHEVYEELKSYASCKAHLRRAFIHELNLHNLDTSEKSTDPLFGSLFTAQGWVPKNKLQELQELTDCHHIVADLIEKEEEEVIPTYLENKGLGRVGEDLVHIYDTPSITDRDPSLWVLISFSFFFGFILNDAGYGLVLLGFSLYLSWRLFKRGGVIQRFLKLCLIISASCVVWGALTTSFFGIEIPKESALRKISLTSYLSERKAEYLNDQGTDYTNEILMELALMVGCVHIILSLLRVIDRNWAGVGWILFIIGCYLHFPKVLGATSIIHFLFGVPPVAGAALGIYLLFGGLIIALVVSPIQNRLAGLAEAAVLIQVFADVLSYLRLYALALAGGIMSATFNEMGAKFGLFGIPIIVAGHAVNLGLGIMGGIIHGLRLNFLEWYHYSFEGGGKMLNPLRQIST